MASRRQPDAKQNAIETALPSLTHAKERLALYSLDKVRGAIGVGRENLDQLPQDTEHQMRLAAIVDKGEVGRWRSLLPPPAEAVKEIVELIGRAPHFAELGAYITMHLRSASVIGLPTQLPPILLVGGHGLGKSWLLSRLGSVLGLPYKRYVMSSSSLSEGLSGSHPSWRNAAPGLVARTLLTEAVANPILFVDELEKGAQHFHNGDPHRAFYALLDPSDSCEFLDEYLGFPINASKVLWVMAANDTASIPAPILDRLRIITVPEPDEAQRARIAASIYAEANAARRRFFDAEPGQTVNERLVGMSPRVMRKVLDEAMVRASAAGRRQLKPDDVLSIPGRVRKRIGFCPTE